MNCKSYKFFTVISNKTRWNIILSLYDSDKCVSDICKNIKEEQSKISHNLKLLQDCKVVSAKRKGKLMIYSLNKKTIKPLITLLEKHMSCFYNGNCNAK